MINLKYKNETISIPTDVYEFDIDLFESLFEVIQNKQIKLFNKWVLIFQFCGIPDEIVNNLSSDEFISIINEFRFDLHLTKIKPKIEINGVEYKCYDKTFDITVKDFILMQNYLDMNPLKNITKVLAILYKSKDEIKNKTVFDRTYIEEKANKFKFVKANYAIPVYNLLNNLLSQQTKFATNE